MTTLDTLLEEIRTGPSGPRIAAFFDFDGTLIDGYSAAALYSHRLRNFEIGPAEAAHTVLAGMRGPLTEDQFAQLVERGTRGWAGRSDDTPGIIAGIVMAIMTLGPLCGAAFVVGR